MSASVKIDPFVNGVRYVIPYGPGVAWEMGSSPSFVPEKSCYVYSIDAPRASNTNPNPTAQIDVRPMSVLTLKPAECGGDCPLQQHGSASIENAKRYYLGPTATRENAELVGVSAGAAPGHVLKGLKISGGGRVWHYEGHGDVGDFISLEDMVPAEPDEDGLYTSDDLYAEMTADATVTPSFERKECLVVKAGNEIANCLDAAETLEGISYDVTELAQQGLTEQVVLDAIAEHSEVFVWNGHGTMWTGEYDGWLFGWGATDPVWSITADEIVALNHGKSYNFVYIASCESGANAATVYKAAFNASCYLGWVGLVSQTVDDPFDQKLWDRLEDGEYVQAAVVATMWDMDMELGIQPYPNCVGNTTIAPYCESVSK